MIIQVLFLTGALVLWESAVGLRWIDRLFLASPSQIVATLPRFLPAVGQAIVFTLTALAAAFGFAALVGLAVGFIVGSSKFLFESLDPFIVLFNAFPKIAAFPILLIVFGPGIGANIGYGFLTAVAIVLFTVTNGRRELDLDFVRVADSMGCTKLQVYSWVVFPYMVPIIFSSLRLGLIAAIRGVLTSELLIPFLGVGKLITNLTYSFKTPELYVTVLVISFATLMVNWGLVRWENRLSRWRAL